MNAHIDSKRGFRAAALLLAVLATSATAIAQSPAPATAPTAKPPKPSSAEKPIEPQVNADEVFREVLNNQVPLTPDQIRELMSSINNSQKAQATAVPPPNPLGVNIPVYLDPGAVIPTVKLAYGYASSLIFVDAGGATWPVKEVLIGDDSAFQAHTSKDAKTNNVVVVPKAPFAHSNAIITLEGHDVPVVLSLETNNAVANYRTTLMIQRFGPNAEAPTLQGPPPLNDELLRVVLDGISPIGAKIVRIDGGPATAFFFKGRFLVRTALKIRSPGYINTMRSGAMAVYELPVTSLISAVNDQGQDVQLAVSDEVLLEASFNTAERGYKLPYAMPVAR